MYVWGPKNNKGRRIVPRTATFARRVADIAAGERWVALCVTSCPSDCQPASPNEGVRSIILSLKTVHNWGARAW